MKRVKIETVAAPAAVGPYSQAIGTDSIVFLSGQIPLDPQSGKIVTESFPAAVRRVLDNVGAVLEAAGSGFDRVIKVTCFLTDMERFVEFNEIYGEYFTEPYPARSCVAVAALPKGVPVEVEVIAAT